MDCPNCTTHFVYRADYAVHLQQCRSGAAMDALLARLNAAAARLQSEFDQVEQQQQLVTHRLHSAA